MEDSKFKSPWITFEKSFTISSKDLNCNLHYTPQFEYDDIKYKLRIQPSGNSLSNKGFGAAYIQIDECLDMETGNNIAFYFCLVNHKEPQKSRWCSAAFLCNEDRNSLGAKNFVETAALREEKGGFLEKEQDGILKVTFRVAVISLTTYQNKYKSSDSSFLGPYLRFMWSGLGGKISCFDENSPSFIQMAKEYLKASDDETLDENRYAEIVNEAIQTTENIYLQLGQCFMSDEDAFEESCLNVWRTLGMDHLQPTYPKCFPKFRNCLFNIADELTEDIVRITDGIFPPGSESASVVIYMCQETDNIKQCIRPQIRNGKTVYELVAGFCESRSRKDHLCTFTCVTQDSKTSWILHNNKTNKMLSEDDIQVLFFDMYDYFKDRSDVKLATPSALFRPVELCYKRVCTAHNKPIPLGDQTKHRDYTIKLANEVLKYAQTHTRVHVLTCENLYPHTGQYDAASICALPPTCVFMLHDDTPTRELWNRVYNNLNRGQKKYALYIVAAHNDTTRLIPVDTLNANESVKDSRMKMNEPHTHLYTLTHTYKLVLLAVSLPCIPHFEKQFFFHALYEDAANAKPRLMYSIPKKRGKKDKSLFLGVYTQDSNSSLKLHEFLDNATKRFSPQSHEYKYVCSLRDASRLSQNGPWLECLAATENSSTEVILHEY